MKVFDAYAASYDLLYRDKDYQAESDFVLDRLRDEITDPIDLLELGCGTGAHAELLVQHGLRVHAVDLSESMLERAQARRRALPADAAQRLSFAQGDVRDLTAGRSFDAVVSLFHVMSYQTADDDLSAALRTAASHLRPGGVFLFDFWYGPAVLRDPPAVRVKRVEDEHFRVMRVAEPNLHHERNVVEVAYHLLVERRADGHVEQVHEEHALRYWFWPELQRHITAAGLVPSGPWAWPDRTPAGADSWQAYAMCRKPPAPR